MENRKINDILRFKPVTKEEAVVGCKVIVNPPKTSSWVNFPAKITAVKGDTYTVSYNSGGTPKTDDVTLDKMVKLIK